jgi:hypothetical protein
MNNNLSFSPLFFEERKICNLSSDSQATGNERAQKPTEDAFGCSIFHHWH